MTTLPGPVDAVCAGFLSAVPEGLVTGLYLHGGLAFGERAGGLFPPQYDDPAERGEDVTAFAAYVVEQGVASR